MATNTFGNVQTQRRPLNLNTNPWNDSGMMMTGGAMGQRGSTIAPPSGPSTTGNMAFPNPPAAQNNSLWNDAANSLAGGGGMTPGQSNLSQYVPQAPSWESNATYGSSIDKMPSWMSGIEGAFDLEAFRNKDDREIWEAMLSAGIPAAQLMQTGYQQGLDYDLASQAQNWAQQGDVFNMQMASQQQQMAEWQAQQMAQQFQQQYGLDAWQAQTAAQQFQQQMQQQGSQFGQQLGLDRDRLGLDRELGMGGLNLQREIGMGQLSVDRDRLGLDRELGFGGLGLAQDRLGLDRELGMGGLDIQREQNRIEQEWRAGQLTNEQYANETNRLAQQSQASFQQGQLGLGRDQLGLDTWRSQQEMQLATAAQRLNELVQTGTLSVAQANQALQELQNQQQFGMQQQQFGFQQQQWGQELDWRRESAAQEAQLAREQMAAQQAQAQMQAFGRQQTPQGRFIRNF